MKDNIENNIGKMFGEGLKEGFIDNRYKDPKKAPEASEKLIEETINDTEIYKRAKEIILNAQKGQVGYGMDKYPEPLSANTWSMIETMKHIIEESVDKLHYQVMMLIKLEHEANGKLDEASGLLKDINRAVAYSDTGPIQYAKADIEAMKDAHDIMFDHNDYRITEKGVEKFKIECRPDYEGKFNHVNINVVLDREDSIDALSYAINNELRKIKDKGIF